MSYLKAVISGSREESCLLVGIFHVVKISQSITELFALGCGK